MVKNAIKADTFVVDRASSRSISGQIVDQVIELKNSKDVVGYKMPSITNLGAYLEINQNTVYRAYSELLVRGVLTAIPGKGTFIAGDTVKEEPPK